MRMKELTVRRHYFKYEGTFLEVGINEIKEGGCVNLCVCPRVNTEGTVDVCLLFFVCGIFFVCVSLWWEISAPGNSTTGIFETCVRKHVNTRRTKFGS